MMVGGKEGVFNGFLSFYNFLFVSWFNYIFVHMAWYEWLIVIPCYLVVGLVVGYVALLVLVTVIQIIWFCITAIWEKFKKLP